MAHGTPRINICHDCKHYTLVSRFSPDPVCPDCGKVTERTNQEEIRRKYKLGMFSYEFALGFGHWEKIKD